MLLTHIFGAPRRPVVRAAALAGAVLGAVGVAGPAAAMTGGQPVDDDGTAPWVATLAVKADAPLLQRAGCGGALIAPDRVLTAAHCVDHTDPSQTEVHIGARVLSQQPGQVREVRSVTSLPGYALLPSPVDPDDPNLSSARDDLAVILLDRPVTGVRPLPVAAARPAPDTPVAMFTHGTTGTAGPDGFRDDVLHRGDFVAMDGGGCAAGTPAVVDPASVWCARAGQGSGSGTCFLDSGSPVVEYVAGSPYLVGIFSFGGETAGRQCGEPSAEYFADVPAFRRWARSRWPGVGQPYPVTEPMVSGDAAVGGTVHCVPPSWSRQRGGQPATITYQWVTVAQEGWVLEPTPVDGANAADLVIGPSLGGTEIACQVIATGSGGTTEAMSAPVAVTG